MGLTTDLRDQLNCRNVKQLKALAKENGINLSCPKKADLVDSLYKKISNDRAKERRKRRKRLRGY